MAVAIPRKYGRPKICAVVSWLYEFCFDIASSVLCTCAALEVSFQYRYGNSVCVCVCVCVCVHVCVCARARVFLGGVVTKLSFFINF